jgi:hypothetical protein
VAGQRVWWSNERHLHNRGNVPSEDYLSGTLERENYKKMGLRASPSQTVSWKYLQ